MTGIVLYKNESLVIDVTIQPNGEIIFARSRLGGDGYLRIAPDEKPALILALTNTLGAEFKDGLSADQIDDQIISLVKTKFGIIEIDPYEDIKSFLHANDLKFKSEYWPSSNW